MPEPLWSCWEQAFVPELVEGLGFLSWGPGGAPASLSWCKTPCSCQVLYLLGCLLDCASGVLNEKPIPALLWKKPAGKKLQSREGQELVRSARKG